MVYVYILLVVINTILIIKRKFDFISIGILAFFLYTSPCFYGHTYIIGGRLGFYYDSEISLSTYLCVYGQLIIMIIYLLCENSVKLTLGSHSKSVINISDKGMIEKSEREFPIFWNLLTVGCLLSFLYNVVFRIGLSNFFSYVGKTTIMENTSGLFDFAIWGSIIVFFHSAERKNIFRLIIAGAMIILTALIGSRAYITTALLGLLVLKGKDVKRVLRNNVRIFIRIGLLFIALIVFKQVFRAIRALDFKEIFNLIDESSIIEAILFNGEGRAVFSIYNYEIVNRFKLPLFDTIARLLSIFPFVNNIISTSYPLRFSRIARNVFFSAGYGVGSNFWAESIAMGGIIFMFFMTLLWLILLNKANMRIKFKNSPYVAVVATYCSFYIHRLDWLQVIGCIKSVLIIFLLMVLWRNITTRRLSNE